MCSTNSPRWVLFGYREHPGPSSSDQMLLSLRSTCLQDVIGQEEHLFWHCFSLFKKKKQNKPQHKDKKWLLFVSQCTEHGYFAEEENIYQQMKHRQAKENRILFIFHEQKKKKKDWLCTKLKIYTKFLVVTTVTKPKSHLAAERKHRNDL